MRSISKSGYDSRSQRVVYYVASIGFAMVLLFSIQAIVVGLTGTDIAYISAGGGVWIVFGTIYHLRERHKLRG